MYNFSSAFPTAARSGSGALRLRFDETGFRIMFVALLLAMAAIKPAMGQATGLSAMPLDDMEFRLIGPWRGGRSIAVVGHPTDRLTFYFGSTGGGVWKTTDA
ncbi:MAG: hypothetical protein VYC03_08685, partial [Pseudomonadota bacterium]|nr:hypothetical protein [Pseudomonadota bacterium]